jgi:hypothetical protein
MQEHERWLEIAKEDLLTSPKERKRGHAFCSEKNSISCGLTEPQEPRLDVGIVCAGR